MSNDLRPSLPDLHDLIYEYNADCGSLGRLYKVKLSPQRRERMRRHYNDWLARLERVDFDALGTDGQIEWLLLKNHLRRKLSDLELEERDEEEVLPLLPFLHPLVDLIEKRQLMQPIEAADVAGTLDALLAGIDGCRKKVSEGEVTERFVANRAVAAIKDLKGQLEEWFGFYNGYDPLFTWWVEKPYQALGEALDAYAKELRETVVGVGPDDEEAIVGNPIGRDALMRELRFEMIDATPEELIEIAEREFSWCEERLLEASRELGFGDDWRAAQEHVKGLCVPPGEQTRVIRELALEAIEWVEERDLLTVPPLAKETWRMSMMPPDKQKVNPFFLGGEQIIVSYPTNEMSHREKLMSMRGNNPHFSRATVQHELIPGHHLQGYMEDRSKPHRQMFYTPFWTEGWTLGWELLLWDLGFPRGPEDRIGMLFWRMHRCARIIFSLEFHLGNMTAQQCIDFLVERVGHERANAEGEVRRSFAGNYSPLYQLAYMIGGIQAQTLRKEVVESGRMTMREFNDTFLRENNIPLGALRAIVLQQPLTRETDLSWRFR